MSILAATAGQPDEAIASLTRGGISWDPSYVFTSLQFHLGLAYFIKEEYQTALEHLEQEKNLEPLYTLTILAATYAELGRFEDARGTVKKILSGNPEVTVALVASVWLFRYDTGSERLLGALRKAGLPEK